VESSDVVLFIAIPGAAIVAVAASVTAYFRWKKKRVKRT
jgi:hypothetical protein